jgi:cell division protein FtsI/penicillin-binding protein 2
VVSLDQRLQASAEAAVAGRVTPTALVAVDIPSGAVLAVADSQRTPGDVLGLQAQYPPGSTFRLVTMLALNRFAGIGPNDAADCRELHYLGQQFSNRAGAPNTAGVPFAAAFAGDCITGFAAAAPSLTNVQLREAATALGLEQPNGLGYPGYNGVVPPAKDLLENVEDAIGEGGVLTSPLALARASATIASGIQRPPSLVTQPVPELPAATHALHPSEQALLAQLMASSVPAELRNVGNGAVSAVCGVAAYGPAADATQHVWCTGYQGSTAFAVLVTKSNAGPSVAASVAAAFLNRPR